MPERSAIRIRAVDLPADGVLIHAIDTSFETDAVFEIARDGRGFHLVETRLAAPITKAFPLDDGSPRAWDSAWIAFAGEEPAGFAATGYDAWNARLTIWHLYVDPEHRRRGIARRLLDEALAAGRDRGARIAWLETSNVNVPGIRAYECLGFELCGLDTSLYDGTPADGEVALFLWRALR